MSLIAQPQSGMVPPWQQPFVAKGFDGLGYGRHKARSILIGMTLPGFLKLIRFYEARAWTPPVS
ncbi:MAG: hypothetical protein BMS9Abin11_0164 [Gammaproteobacteria bacterium]|nr:MAG: hypothetical protein BMS9Abin11_0164 [Gammaproteobacteria bacterium]